MKKVNISEFCSCSEKKNWITTFVATIRTLPDFIYPHYYMGKYSWSATNRVYLRKLNTNLGAFYAPGMY